ncbi:hypothetical protein ACLKMY_20370 [Paraburkholderia mimosarum]|uniref:hypothetical protein n=1 Tax=Paraburkholderia mimosarum TaxID=312026 RepID=UPI0003FC26AF|nr:hypothetical protein [Paraburkholderia mimosarum]
MNPPRKKNPTVGVAVFIVAVVLFVIGAVLFNALKSKREYDETSGAGVASATATASTAASQGGSAQ